MNIYYNVLSKFGYYLDHDSCPQTKSFVEMDDIHDSFIANGIEGNNEEKNYCIKAKQFAINRENNKKRQMELLRRHYAWHDSLIENHSNLDEYGLSDDEKILCEELLHDKKANESCITRRYREKLLESIKSKLYLYFHVKYYMGKKC